MFNPIYTIESGDLGDNLFVTPIFRHHLGAVIQMNDSIESRNVARLYDHVAAPIYTPFVHNQITTWYDNEHKSVRILREVGRKGDDPLPYVIITEHELAAARGLVGGLIKPVLVSFNVRVGNTDTARYRSPGLGLSQNIVNVLVKEGYYPVCITRAPVLPKQILNHVLYIGGIDLRMFLACCKVIGLYCGIDSGPLHAMVAVGGKVIGTIPSSHRDHFPHGCYLWQGDAIWQGRKPRVAYVQFNEIGALRERMEVLQ